MQYCESVKNLPNGWKVCLELFVQSSLRSPESRLFSLQVIDNMLVYRSSELSPEDVETIKKVLFNFIEQRYVTDYYQQEQVFIKNKLAHTITLLFLLAYPENWQSFFPNLSKIAGLDNSSTNINAYTADFFLKVQTSIDEEMVNPVVPRSKAEIDRNTKIKDAMRESDTDILANVWYTILSSVSDGAKTIDNITPALRSELVSQTLKAIGVYASWINITLVVNDHFKPLIFKYFSSDEFCSAAIHCVTRIVGKGMQPTNKLELTRYLGLTQIIRQFVNVGDEDFRKDLAYLINTFGNELVSIAEKEGQSGQDVRRVAYQEAENLVELALQLSQDEYHGTTLILVTFINNFIAIYKKTAGQNLTDSQRSILNQILRAIIKKLEYKDDHDFSDFNDPKFSIDDGGADSSDSDETFFSLRHELRTLMDAVATIDFELFETTIIEVIKPILESIRQSGVNDNKGNSARPVGWIKAELALTLIRIYSDWLVSARPANLPQKLTAPSVTRTSSILANTRLPEVMKYMIESNISQSHHPSITPLFFETCVRQSYFYIKETQYIKPVLMVFVGETGIRSQYGAVRTRTWYLFYRFLKQVEYGPFATDLIEGVRDMLTIQAEIPSANEEGYGVFDSQLYLFEAVGMALSATTLDDTKRAQFLDIIFNPLINQATELVSSNVVSSNQQALLQVHHIISATGSLAKGFPDAKVDAKSLTPPEPSLISASGKAALKKVTELNIAVLRSLHQHSVIREAVRFAFSRLLTVLGAEAFDYVPSFIDAIFPSCTAEEWKDILTFLGLVAFKFKAHAAPILANVLLRVSDSVFTLVKSIDPQQGTDDAILAVELKTAYLNWILSIFTSSMDPIFWTVQNESGWSIIFKQISEWALPPGPSSSSSSSATHILTNNRSQFKLN